MRISSYFGIYGRYTRADPEDEYSAYGDSEAGAFAAAVLLDTFFGRTSAQTGPEIAHVNPVLDPEPKIEDLRPGTFGSNPVGLRSLGSDTFVELNDGNGSAPWWLQDSQTFVRVTDPEDGITSAGQFTRINDTVFFSGNTADQGSELYVLPLDELVTPAPQLLKDINSGAASSFPSFLTPTGGMLFFAANNGANNAVGGEALYVSDGTPDGTVFVEDVGVLLAVGAMAPINALGTVPGVIFGGGDGAGGGIELWKSDGTGPGTVRIRDINLGEGSSDPQGFTPIWDNPEVHYFAADDGVNGEELWKTDGTEAGTTPVADINPGAAGSDLVLFGSNMNTLFFMADDGASGRQLWATDGTEPGTRPVKVINPGGNAFSMSGPKTLVVDEIAYFVADDGVHGRELWRSDGTEDGTGMVIDINPGASSSEPVNLTLVNGSLLFEAADSDSFQFRLYHTLGTADSTVELSDSFGFGVAGIAVQPALPLFFQEEATGRVAATLFQNGKHLGWSATTDPLGSNWEARAVGEVRAGITGPELFMQDISTGEVIYTSYDSLGQRQWGAVPGELPGWTLLGAGDFIGDERSEIVIRNEANGTHFLGRFGRDGEFDEWFQWTTPFKDEVNNKDYQFVGAGDWNGDGTLDGFFQNQMGSGDVIGRSIINGVAQDFLVTDRITLDYQVTAAGDFDGDGTADIAVQNRNTGEAVFKSSTFATDEWAPLFPSFAAGGVLEASADIDQDGDAEILTQIDGVIYVGHVGPAGIASWAFLANMGTGWEGVFGG